MKNDTLWTRVIALLLLGSAAAFIIYRVQTRPVPRVQPSSAPLARGAFHIHSSTSHDSQLSLKDIAAAAREIGLQFVVITDHNQQQAAPTELNGVTFLSGAELSTSYGHLIQLGAPDVLGEKSRRELNVVEQVRELGALPLVAHPSDIKRPWDGPLVDVAGVEIANLGSSTRRRGGLGFLRLLPALAVLKVRPELSVVQVLDRDHRALERWDEHPDPEVIGLCAADAHGRLDLRHNLSAWELVLTDVTVAIDADGGLAPVPPETIMEHLRRGRFYCAAAALGERPRFRFFARGVDQAVVTVGESAMMSDVRELVVEGPRIEGNAASIVLLRNGEELVRTRGEELVYTYPGPGTYRVEIRAELPEVLFGERRVPIIYSNRIRVLRDGLID